MTPTSGDEIRTAIRAAAAERGEPLSSREYDDWAQAVEEDVPRVHTISHQIGWIDACAAADVVPAGTRRTPRKQSEETLLDAVQRVWEIVGHQPAIHEYRNHRRDEDPTDAWFYKRKPGDLDTWGDVCAAVKERLASGESDSAVTSFQDET